MQRLTMRFSDAGLRCRERKLVYPDHRPIPWLTEDAKPRDRSNRLLDGDIARLLGRRKARESRRKLLKNPAHEWKANRNHHQ